MDFNEMNRNLEGKGSRDQKVRELAEKLQRRGLAMTKESARQLAESMVQTEERVQKTFQERKENASMYNEPKREQPVVESAKGPGFMQTKTLSQLQDEHTAKRAKAEEMRQNALENKPINIQNHFDTPENDKEWVHLSPEKEAMTEEDSSVDGSEVEPENGVEQTPEPAVPETTPEPSMSESVAEPVESEPTPEPMSEPVESESDSSMTEPDISQMSTMDAAMLDESTERESEMETPEPVVEPAMETSEPAMAEPEMAEPAVAESETTTSESATESDVEESMPEATPAEHEERMPDSVPEQNEAAMADDADEESDVDDEDEMPEATPAESVPEQQVSDESEMSSTEVVEEEPPREDLAKKHGVDISSMFNVNK
jgi:hypothetical protein